MQCSSFHQNDASMSAVRSGSSFASGPGSRYFLLSAHAAASQMSTPDFPEDSDQLLEILHDSAPLAEKLERLHQVLRQSLGFVDRIALTYYDQDTDTLRTFAHSTDNGVPLVYYQSRLADSFSLSEIARTRKPRVVNDLAATYRAPTEHGQKIRTHGFAASYTMPVFHSGTLYGFVFFNSRQKDVFAGRALHELNLMGHLLALLMVSEVGVIRTITSSVRTVSHIAQSRDFETGNHLERMAHYARLIARKVAPHFGFDDVFIEYLFLFAPLHDIGKVAVPDAVLLKPGRLTGEEFDIIKTHCERGVQMVDAMLENFGLDSFLYADMLRAIVLAHHEALDGSGYPHALKAEEIPVAARIVAVADVLDALTSARPYKAAWTLDEALAMLRDNAGKKFDAVCVQALLDHRDEVEEIRRQFVEDYFG